MRKGTLTLSRLSSESVHRPFRHRDNGLLRRLLCHRSTLLSQRFSKYRGADSYISKSVRIPARSIWQHSSSTSARPSTKIFRTSMNILACCGTSYVDNNKCSTRIGITLRSFDQLQLIIPAAEQWPDTQNIRQSRG
jgi:hypothetical protein